MARPHDANNLTDRSLGLRLSLLYAALFLSTGLYLPYWPVWLASRGLSPVDIGMLFAVARLTNVVSSPFIAQFCDHRGDRRRPLLVLSGSTVVVFSLFNVCGSLWEFTLVAIAGGAVWGSIMPLSDSLAMVNVQQRQIQYGRVRLWGSVSFILATLAGGRSLELLPDASIFWILLASFAVIFAACLFLPDTRVPPSPIRLTAFWQLLRSPVFLIFLLSSALLQTSHQAVYIFGTLHWRVIGISGSSIGVLWAIGVVAEVAVFALGARLLTRLGPERMMVLAALAGIVRWPLLAYATSLPVLIAAQTLHGLTFGATHLAAMAFIGQAIPHRLSATAQSVHSAVALGIAFAAVAQLLGIIFEAQGAGVFLAMTVLSFGGGVSALILKRCWSGRELFA